MADTYKVSATNVSDGPRVFNAMPQIVVQRGGSTGLVEISAGEFASMTASGYFDITGGPVDDPHADTHPALTGKNKAELLAIAKAEGVTLAEGATNPEIVTAIEAHRKA